MCVNAVFATFGHCFLSTESLRLLYDTCAFCIALSGCPELVTCGEVDGAGHARVSIAQSWLSMQILETESAFSKVTKACLNGRCVLHFTSSERKLHFRGTQFRKRRKKKHQINTLAISDRFLITWYLSIRPKVLGLEACSQ